MYQVFRGFLGMVIGLRSEIIGEATEETVMM